MKNPFLFLLLFFPLVSCSRHDFSNTRAYVEGKITSSQKAEDITVQIISQGKAVAETSPSEDKTFILSGPLFEQGFSILFNSKIESFECERKGLSLSADSLSISVPGEISYLKFNNIQLQP